jgi:FlaA1/EpsC-like NDP-sugar epimerase
LKVIITGGGGSIGSYLVKELIKERVKVIVIDSLDKDKV